MFNCPLQFCNINLKSMILCFCKEYKKINFIQVNIIFLIVSDSADSRLKWPYATESSNFQHLYFAAFLMTVLWLESTRASGSCHG